MNTESSDKLSTFYITSVPSLMEHVREQAHSRLFKLKPCSYHEQT
jgi:hypothetical protein